MGETRFSVEAKRENPPGHADGRLGGFESSRVRRAVFFEKFLRGCCPIESVRIGFMPVRLDFDKLFLALEKLVDWIKR
jgi:hypothetical protein